MCGISGLINLNKPVSLVGYYDAHLRLRHRGLDDEGFFCTLNGESHYYRGDDSIVDFNALPHIQQVNAANVVLGHRRLSIIDLSAAGHQPMCDVTGRYVMVYNGEIFNYLELRHELINLGYHFKTESDSEVLLTAFTEWGVDCFNKFNGMWAVVIYDTVERCLILCRDRFGIKPLYYTLVGDTLFFGSEVKYLIPFLSKLQMNEQLVMEYLVDSLTDHYFETMFEGIYQVMPARYIRFDSLGLYEQVYWQLPITDIKLSLNDATDQLLSLLTSSIELRLRSDVPIGSLLSGGLDSTTIVCLVKMLLEKQGRTSRFDTFSAVFEEERYSERSYIEETIKQTDLPVHWIYPDPSRLSNTVTNILYHQEFPFRSLAVYSQWEIMRHVAETPITVLLNGQGSDEIFAGYHAHYAALIGEYLRLGNFSKAWRESQHLSAARGGHSLAVILGGIQQLLLALSPSKRLPDKRIPYLAYSYRRYTDWKRQTNVLHNKLVHDLTFSALPEYLRYEDRNSMAFTLESRLPFMDYRLVEWAMSLPSSLKIDRGTNKLILRQTASPFIPKNVMNRKDKMGFVSPQEKWQISILKPQLDKLFCMDLQTIFPFVDGAEVQRLYTEYQSGRTDQRAWVIWRLTCLTWWYRLWWN